MKKFEFIALTLSGLSDPSIAIAASRAGESGVLDLQHIKDERMVERAVSALVHYGRGRVGVRLDSQAFERVCRLTPDLLSGMRVVILTPDEPGALSQRVEFFHRLNSSVFLETTAAEQADLGIAAGVDAIIAKGQEAGGWVGDEPALILLQRMVRRVSVPVWAHGGIGLHSIAACYAAGVAGVVLDAQLALCRESSLSEAVKTAVGRMDGSETVCVGEELGAAFRLYARPGSRSVESLRLTARALSEGPRPRRELLLRWQQAVEEGIGWDSAAGSVWPLGQDAAFAVPLAKRFVTVGGVLHGLRKEMHHHVQAARTLRPLEEGNPLADSHGTRFPIVQGPMTRVSDQAAFAERVADAGALPFLALALMRGAEVKALLEATRRLLGKRPWGVGILGFVPHELRKEQLALIHEVRPPYALIAGGRPDQARSLEEAGIPTYLHVPSPGLLRLFWENGARRFVFEGRECGGHVGPRTSFVLWEMMVEVLTEVLPAGKEAERCHVIFAGGIHDELSSAMVAALAAPLAERGVKIGVLMGTAYLFTEEAVATGAIVKGFQEEAIKCTRTILLETGPGHATRCADTSFGEVFRSEQSRLLKEGCPAEEIREALEGLNLGRLRIASKGIARSSRTGQDAAATPYVEVHEEQQRTDGMYMIGQVATIRDRVSTIEELHREVSVDGTQRLERLALPVDGTVSSHREERPSDIAIIGMGALLPKAPDTQTYWANILGKVNALTEVPADRWDWRRYFDADPQARDKVYSKWGGFLDPIPFDPMRYGIPPSAIPSIEPLQLLTLEVVRAALEDAGYGRREFDRERTSVIFGVGGGSSDLGQQYAFRSSLPQHLQGVDPKDLVGLPEWTEDTFPGILLNVVAGRVANRFNLGGVNYTVDAACASSLAAIYLAIRELEACTSDMVIVGGGDTVQNPFSYLCFSKTHALSPRGQCRPFDASADGIVISEGIGVVVLKRLADAERDGDRIYAVIKAACGSSDGRDKGLSAPRPEGQVRVLERAYAKAGFSPATVELIEAHGTGTVAGDQAEIESLGRVWKAAVATRRSCAVGSVKSMIGHTKCTAGVAGLMKVALALFHKVLPPTMGVDTPNPKAHFAESPFYVNSEARPWINPGVDCQGQHPRRAGVSSFGFGGTNFHVVLEEYEQGFPAEQAPALLDRWESELLVWSGATRSEILNEVAALERALASGAMPSLADLAYTVASSAREREARGGAAVLRLAVVANSVPDLQNKLAGVRQALAGTEPCLSILDPRGIFYTERPLAREGKIAFLFPGQGSQYPDMLRELALRFPEVRERFHVANRVLDEILPRLSAYVYPPPRFSPEEEQASRKALAQTRVAQPALGAADMGMFMLLQALGVRPDMLAGHSYGEYVALCAAGVFDEETLYRISEARGRFIEEGVGSNPGTMAAVEADEACVMEVLAGLEGVCIANLNSPRQTIISGHCEAIAQASKRFKAKGILVRSIPVSCAFHSPLMAHARNRFAAFLAGIPMASPRCEVYSNTYATPYPPDPKVFLSVLDEHLVRPVKFFSELVAMYEGGARIFVEVGPRTVLSGLAHQCLEGRDHIAVACDYTGRSGILQLCHALGTLFVHGVPVDPRRLFEGRAVRLLNLDALAEETKPKSLPPTAWYVHGGRAWPANKPAPAMPEPLSLTTTAARGDSGPGSPQPKPAPLAPSATPTQTPDLRPAGAAQVPYEAAPSELSRATGSGAGSSLGTGDAEQVIVEYQRVMRLFLETQANVMQVYLGQPRPAQDAIAMAPAAVSAPELALRARAETGAPVELKREGDVSQAPPDVTAKAEDRASGVSAAATGPTLDEESLTQKLLQIVSERTGYPTSMLGLDMNLEADLGVDSIKRVEVLGTFQRAFPVDVQTKIQAVMEQLTATKTLREALDMIKATILPGLAQAGAHPAAQPVPPEAKAMPPAAPEPVAVEAAGEEGVAVRQDVPRSVLIPVDRPLSGLARPVSPGRLCVITDDEEGAAQALAGQLERLGARVTMVRHRGPGSNGTGHEERWASYSADLADPAAVQELVKQIRREQGPVGGLIHLLPLRGGAPLNELDFAGWRQRLAVEVKGFFYLLQALTADLKAATGEKSWVAAATRLGWASSYQALASPSGGPPFFPGQGGVAGLIKTLAREMPMVVCKAVDCDPRDPVAAVADNLVQELTTDDAEVEIGYQGAHRRVLRCQLALLRGQGSGELPLDRESVVLITGGARGITAEVAMELARYYKSIFVLVGRSPLPPAEEDPGTAQLTSPHEIKSALVARMRRSGQEIKPVQVEAAYSRLRLDREIRRTLAAIRQAGAAVHYYHVDVRDEAAFGSLIDELYRTFGRLDGVIHGAGIIEDKLVELKSPESFDRVFDTKADSAFVLSRKLRAESLKFLVFFSSVAGRFGNRGQGDYAAANEVLNKLAVYLDRIWPARVVAMNWGPWASSGMVSPEVLRQFKERGVQVIEPDRGRRMVGQEIEEGRKGAPEVVIGGGPWETLPEPPAKPALTTYPLLAGLSLTPGPGGAVEVVRVLDPEKDGYLKDHCLDGRPVFPFAMAMELMAEAVQAAWPEWRVVGFRDVRLFKGIVLDDRPKPVHITVRSATSPYQDRLGVDVTAELRDSVQPKVVYYRATVELGNWSSSVPADPAPCQEGLAPYPKSVGEAYREWLFHGPLFQRISSIEGLSQEMIVARLRPSSAEAAGSWGAQPWLVDPFLVDCAPQLLILWARAFLDLTPLPTRLDCFRFIGPLSSACVRCMVRILPASNGSSVRSDVYFMDAEDRVLGWIEGLEAIGSKAMNRIAVHDR